MTTSAARRDAAAHRDLHRAHERGPDADAVRRDGEIVRGRAVLAEGRLICLDAATIKGVVDRLSLRRLVTVVNDPLDRRRRAVALTTRGRELTAEALKVASEITAATLSPLSTEEQLQLARLLNRIA